MPVSALAHIPRRTSSAVAAAIALSLWLAACQAGSSAPASAEPSPLSSAGETATAEPTPTPTSAPTAVDATAAAGLAFVRFVGDREQLFVVDPDGSARQVGGQGEFAALGAAQPLWSPDRSMIAFGPPTIGSGLDPQLWLVNADGTNQRPIATLGEWTDWSPDSSRLVWTDSVFTTDNTGESARIWVADVATGEVTQLAPRGTVTWWLPDGEHIAYTPAENPEAGISVIPVAGGEPRHLTTGVGPFWSPDGTAFLVERDTAIHILSADASTDRVLLDRGGSPAWSPDGTRVAFVDVDDVGTFIVGVTDLDGNVQWSEVPGTDPEWSPDGRRLAVEVFDGQATRIDILDAATGEVIWEVEGRFPDW
jgi:Tol biopolymer transport system component